MKYPHLLLMVAGVLLQASVMAQKHFTVTVVVKDIQLQSIRLEQLTVTDNTIFIDSANTNNEGQFILHGTCGEPGLYRLYFAHDKFIFLSLDSGTVTVNVDWNDFNKYTTSGSAPTGDLQKFILATRGFMTNMNTMNIVFDSLTTAGNDSLLAVAKHDAADMALQFTQQTKQYAETNLYEPNAVFAAKIINKRTEMAFLLAFNKNLAKRFPGTQMTKDFGEYVSKREQEN